MQFYLNGYRTGNPFIEDPHPSVAERPGGLPQDTDVLIIGGGPAPGTSPRPRFFRSR